jgi:hypothetical protein
MSGNGIVIDHHDFEALAHEAFQGRKLLLLVLVGMNGIHRNAPVAALCHPSVQYFFVNQALDCPN